MISGALRAMAMLLVLAVSASGLVVGFGVEKEHLGNMSLEAVYFKMDEVARTGVKANLKFENGVKPGYHAKNYGMEEFYMTEELYVMDPQGEVDCDETPLENEPNSSGTYCEDWNSQAMKNAYSMARYDYSKASTYLMEYVVNETLALENKVYEEMYLQWSAVLVEVTNYVVKYVNEIMGYLDFVVHQLFIKGKTMCFAVLWLVQPQRSYCTTAAGLALQLASCFHGVAEGRIFQFTMFSMMVVCGMILMAVYMRRHVAKKEHVSRISKKRRRFRTNELR